MITDTVLKLTTCLIHACIRQQYVSCSISFSTDSALSAVSRTEIVSRGSTDLLNGAKSVGPRETSGSDAKQFFKVINH